MLRILTVTTCRCFWRHDLWYIFHIIVHSNLWYISICFSKMATILRTQVKAVFNIDKVLPYYLSYHEAEKTIRDSILSISFFFFGFLRFNTRHPDEMFLKTFFKHVQHTFPLWCILFRDFTTILHKLSTIFIDNNQIISGQFI